MNVGRQLEGFGEQEVFPLGLWVIQTAAPASATPAPTIAMTSTSKRLIPPDVAFETTTKVEVFAANPVESFTVRVIRYDPTVG